MLHWYTRAAEGNSSEGLFYLGWAHHQGVGTPCNATLAALHYTRSFRSAGKVYSRAVAALLGLWTLQVEKILEPIAGGWRISILKGWPCALTDSS